MLKELVINEQNVIFDLDGTLIDSAPAILEAFKLAFRECEITLACPLNASIVGPPLSETIAMLAGTTDESVIKALINSFKNIYDEKLCCTSLPFSGVDHFLGDLLLRGHHLYLATNKRQAPTQKIVSYLNWGCIFSGIYSLDSFSPRMASKSELLCKIVNELGLDEKNTIYIGDRNDDSIAALAAGMTFQMVHWSYTYPQHHELK